MTTSAERTAVNPMTEAIKRNEDMHAHDASEFYPIPEPREVDEEPCDPETEDLAADVAEHVNPEDLNRGAAEYLIKREARIVREMNEALAFINAELAEAWARINALQERRREIAKPYLNRAAWLEQSFHGPLFEWARQALAFAKSKSIKLAYGTVGFRKQQDAIAFGDPEKGEAGKADTVRWAVARGQYDVLTVDAAKLKAYVKEFGDVPDGVIVVTGEDKPYIKFAEVEA